MVIRYPRSDSISVKLCVILTALFARQYQRFTINAESLKLFRTGLESVIARRVTVRATYCPLPVLLLKFREKNVLSVQ